MSAIPRDDDGTLARCPFCQFDLSGRSPPDHLVDCGEFERKWRDDDRVTVGDSGTRQTQLPLGGGA